MPTRRTVLTQAAALAATSAWPMAARSQLSLGSMQIDVVNDGFLTLPGDFIFGTMPQDELLPVLDQFGQSRDTLTPPCNITLLRDGTRTILFDVGSGPDFAPSSGILVDSLDQLGVAPEDVTDVIFTHAHPDHLWGLLDDFGDPLFSEASYMIGKTEWDYWMNPNTVDEIGEARAAFAVGAERRLSMIEDNITFFEDGDEILPGIAARASFGHTPGHMCFEVSDGSNSAMILGDAIGNNHVAFARPDWRSGSDQDPDMAATTRTSLLDQLTASQMQLVGFHLPGGLGHVEKSGDSYKYVEDAT